MHRAGLFLVLSSIVGVLSAAPGLETRGESSTSVERVELTASVVSSPAVQHERGGRDPVKPVPWGKPAVVKAVLD